MRTAIISMLALTISSTQFLPCSAAEKPTILNDFSLPDQEGQWREFSFPREKPVILVIAGKGGVKHIEGWVKPIHAKFGDRVSIDGIAKLKGVPKIFRGLVRRSIAKGTERPVLLDWSGGIVDQLPCEVSMIAVVVLSRSGELTHYVLKEYNEKHFQSLIQAVERLLSSDNNR